MCGAGPAHAFYFGLYEHLKSMMVSQTNPDSTYNHIAHAASGACATVVHDAVMTPADGKRSHFLETLLLRPYLFEKI